VSFDAAQDLQAIGPVELVIRNYKVERISLQDSKESLLIGDLLSTQVGELTTQLAANQQSVIRIVVH
jgi:hypothetical protein